MDFITSGTNHIVVKPLVVKPVEKKTNLARNKKEPQAVKPKEVISAEEKQLFDSAINLYNGKNYPEAEDVLTQLLQRYPDSRMKFEATYYLGEIKYSQKKYDEALMYYNKIAEDFSTSSFADKAMYRISSVYYQKKEYANGLKNITIFQYKYKKSKLIDNSCILKGRIYEALNQYPNAVSSYETVINSYSDSDSMDQAYYYLGQVYETAPAVRDLEKSSLYYQKVVDNYPDSKYFPKAKERIKFLNENFLNYR